jgi:hypothetical protein
MPRDYGDQFPSDVGDSRPSAPTVNFNETNTRRIGVPDHRIQPQVGFDARMDRFKEQFQQVRHVWIGTILDDNLDGSFTVLLQDGREVTAYDIYTVPGYTFIEAQSVTVIAGARANVYAITGQKYPIYSPVQYVKLSEILIVGDSAKGKVMLSVGDNGWEETNDEVTVYDTFYQNYGLKTEVLPYTYNVATQTATIIGEHGLIRMGVATAGILIESFGDVQVYDKDGEVDDAIISASLTWMHNNQNIPAGKEVLIKWFIELDDWIVIGREC